VTIKDLIAEQEAHAELLRADIAAMEDKLLWFGQSPDGKKMPLDMTGQINQARSKLQQVEAHIASMKAKLKD
jgi:hypothetical protein